jgi:serine/threonine-protein kinase RsbW
MQPDVVILTVPARSDYARTVRMTAAQLASRIGMTYDQVDDVRIAAEEAFVYACECAAPDAPVTFTFALTESSLAITVGPLTECCTTAAGPQSGGYAEFILRSVCDEFSIEHAEGSCSMRLVCCTPTSTGGTGA